MTCMHDGFMWSMVIIYASDSVLSPPPLRCAGPCSLVRQIGAETGEKLWRMPLAEEYGDEVKSKISDLKNVGARPGSSITAALFLKEFVQSVSFFRLFFPPRLMKKYSLLGAKLFRRHKRSFRVCLIPGGLAK